MSHWTPEDMPDVAGRIALVTGANSGIGFHTALELTRRGARTLLACRNMDRAREAAARIDEAVPHARGTAEIVRLDLSSLDSVRDAAGEIADRTATLDILVNNAGVMAPAERLTADGFELQFGTNHLGHFALTGRLLPLLLASDAARVVTVGSVAHRSARAVWAPGDPGSATALGERGHRGHRDDKQGRWSGYARSKLANLLFARELDRRSKAARTSMVSVAAHPGYAATELLGKTSYGGRTVRVARLSDVVMRLTAQSSAMGAWPSLYGATMPDLTGGEYIGPRGPGGFRGAPIPARMSRIALDDVAAAGLWEYSISATGVGYEELAV